MATTIIVTAITVDISIIDITFTNHIIILNFPKEIVQDYTFQYLKEAFQFLKEAFHCFMKAFRLLKVNIKDNLAFTILAFDALR